MIKHASAKATRLMHIIFHTMGLKNISDFRYAVEEEFLHMSSAYKTSKWPDGDFNNPSEVDVITHYFLRGWNAAGGEDLFVTWHKKAGRVHFVFWREDPACLLEKMLQEQRPDLFVKSVQEA
jgi:hypothetical protein